MIHNIITTVAGNGTPSLSGDGGQATNATLNHPSGIAVDTDGNLFIADYENNRIRRIDTNGIITTVAGNGSASFSGDSGAAINATIWWPVGVAIDSWGNLLIADSRNLRIRKVDTNGIITTVAGNGSSSFSGDGGIATNAGLSPPYGVAVDMMGNILIADQNNRRIRKVAINGIITTVAGNGGWGFSGDGGTATSATFDLPRGVAVDSTGNFFIVDNSDSRIRKVTSPSYLPKLVLNTAVPLKSPVNIDDYDYW